MKTPLVGVALGAATLASLGSAPAVAQNPGRAPAVAQSPANSKPSLADQKFLKEAASGGVAEIELGRLAASKASSPEVKAFAQHMVDDHGKANEQLKAAVAPQGITLPSEMPSEAKKSYEKLSKLSGAEFDRAYIQDMVRDHRKDVKLFEDQAKNGKDPTLKQFAQATLPTLKEHLQQVERLAKR
jgi:putative membrane protein